MAKITAVPLKPQKATTVAAVSKCELRRLKNRASAERSRKVKDDAIAALQQRISSSSAEITALTAVNAALRRAFNERQTAAGLPLLPLQLQLLDASIHRSIACSSSVSTYCSDISAMPPALEPAVF